MCLYVYEHPRVLKDGLDRNVVNKMKYDPFLVLDIYYLFCGFNAVFL